MSLSKESMIRECIRRILLEVDVFGCEAHSLGWIDDSGNFIDLTEGDLTHGEYLEIEYGDGLDLDEIIYGWIKISNAKELYIVGSDWGKVTSMQIHGLIDMWLACKEYSRWIKNDIERFRVNFMSERSSQKMTIPDFLSRYGNVEHEDRFFMGLLGEGYKTKLQRLLHESRMASIERKIYSMMAGRPISLDKASRSVGISARELRNLLSRSSLLSFSGSYIVPRGGY